MKERVGMLPLGDSLLVRLSNQVIHHRIQILALPIRRQLPIGTGTVLYDRADLAGLFAGLELVEHFVDPLEELFDQLKDGDRHHF